MTEHQYTAMTTFGCDQRELCGCRKATKQEIENFPTECAEDGTTELWCPECELDCLA